MAKSSRREQKKELRAKKEEQQAKRVIRWIFIGLGVLAIAGIIWGSFM